MTDRNSGLDDDDLQSLLPFFIAQTRSRLAEIKAYRQAILNRQDTAAAMKSVRDLAHKICGTADTFGFPQLGVLAGRVEDINLAHVVGSDVPAALCLQMERAIDPLIEEMVEILEPGKNSTTV